MITWYVYCLRLCWPCPWLYFSQDFVFPEDVSFSIGGPDTSKYMVIEMHYDNPVGVQGTYVLQRLYSNEMVLVMISPCI